MTMVCPVCERGELMSATVEEVLRYDGQALRVAGVEISTCRSCGEELVLPEQARANERRFADAKRRHDGLMTSDEIIQWRRALGWTQAQAAAALGGGANAFSKYERGEVIQSRAMDLLMRVTRAVPEAREVVEALTQVASRQTRRAVQLHTLGLSGWQADADTAVIEAAMPPLHWIAAQGPQRLIAVSDRAYG